MLNLLQQLKTLKDDARLGARDIRLHSAAKARLMAAIVSEGANDVQTREVTASPRQSLVLHYYRFAFGSLISKPLAAAALGLFVLTGGWLTTVSAAENSLPGDALYTVKLINEKAQLQLASLDRRAVLHTEFAEKRLQEAAQLRDTAHASLPEAKNLVRQAMNGYQREMASAQQDLKQLQEESDASSVGTASDVQENVAALDTVIDASVVASPNADTNADAQDAKDTARDVNQTAVDVAVDSHEANATGQSAQELIAMFHRNLGTLDVRQAFDVHRLAVITVVLKANKSALPASVVPASDELREIAHTLDTVMDAIPGTMDAVAAGGYRDAFATLRTIDTALRDTESRIAEIEIAISGALTAPTSPTSTDGDADTGSSP